jgi:hypothetical protein
MRAKHTIQQLLFTTVISAGLVASPAAEEKKSSSPPVVRGVEELVTVTAKVEAVDLAKRELTVRGPLGNVGTFVVSDEVKRLDEIKPGDEIRAEYYLGITAELRPPTAEEKKEPFLVLEEKGRGTKEVSPRGGGARLVRVVATVEGLDRPSQTATLKGPRGRYLVVRVKDPTVLEKARLGDTVVVTCAEALAVSIEKVKRKD